MRRASVALIDEARCIGCARCLEVCPFDAIVGADGLMHTVVAPWCTGCALCLPPCPVDCIAMLPAPPLSVTETRAAAQRARRRKLRIARRLTRPATDRGRRRAILAAALRRPQGA